MNLNPVTILILLIIIACLRILWGYEDAFGYEQSKFLKKVVVLLCIILGTFLGFILKS